LSLKHRTWDVFAHRLLQEQDIAMPLNLYDPKSGMSYFQAEQPWRNSIALAFPSRMFSPSPIGKTCSLELLDFPQLNSEAPPVTVWRTLLGTHH